MKFDKIRWSCPWNSDQNCTQNSARGWLGPRGWVGGWVGLNRVTGGGGGPGVRWVWGVGGLISELK